MKVKAKDGHYYYYYYKKKNGRKKKRGPKKKPKQRGRSWQETWDYKIVQSTLRKQKKYIGKYHDLEEVEKVKEQLLLENQNVVFPSVYTNNGHLSNKIIESENEYLVLKRIKSEDEDNTSRLRNEFGKFVEHRTNSEQWYIYDKFPCVIEETFWVYGFNPKNQRKTFTWVCDNLITGMIVSPFTIIRIYLYNNKVIIQYDDDFNFVICKNVSDSIRFYNLLNSQLKDNKQMIFIGMVDKHSKRVTKVIEMLREKTGWSNTKICRRSTRS